jgi:hypothetical protein
MPENTVDDIPRIVEAIRSACSRYEMRLVDVSKKHVQQCEKYAKVVSKLSSARPIMIRWTDGFATNELLEYNFRTRAVRPLILVTYRDRRLEITEATKLPTENFHIYIRNLLTGESRSTCIACMEPVENIISCCTCCNDVFCSDCIIDAMDQNDQLPCPLCRCPDFWKNSFVGSMGSHPDLFAKFKSRHQHSDNESARSIVRFLEEGLRLRDLGRTR